MAFHLHCVSDSTGETIRSVARACMVQFDVTDAVEHLWPLARTPRAMERVLEDIASHPGPVMFTLVNDKLRDQLVAGCRALKVPCISVLDPLIAALGTFLGAKPSHLPGRQHELDAEYFSRIEAMEWSLAHDDGQRAAELDSADVVLVGVSRTSKTPTCLYLANRGVRAANVPYVPGVPLPPELKDLRGPLVIGLSKSPQRLVEIRRARLLSLNQEAATAYVDLDRVKAEITEARRYFSSNEWPAIDVTQRSIEETAAAIMQHLNRHREAQGMAQDAASGADSDGPATPPAP